MVSFDRFSSVYCPTCKKVQPARFDHVKANAYLDHRPICWAGRTRRRSGRVAAQPP